MKPKTPKNLKKWHYSASGLWFGLHDLHWPFIFFQESLMSKKSSGMQKNIFRPLFHQHQFPNEIFQNRSVCDDIMDFLDSISFDVDKVWEEDADSESFLEFGSPFLASFWLQVTNFLCQCLKISLIGFIGPIWVLFTGRKKQGL